MSSVAEWLTVQLWEFSFIPLGAAFIALSVAAGRSFRVLTRKVSLGRTVTREGPVAVGGVVFIALVVAWSSGVVAPAPGPKPFEAEGWHSKEWTRWGMAQQLVESGRLLGKEREEVDSLLVGMDGSYTPPGVDPRDVDAWKLYRPQDLLVSLPPELVVIYRDGRVARAWIEPGIPDW